MIQAVRFRWSLLLVDNTYEAQSTNTDGAQINGRRPMDTYGCNWNITGHTDGAMLSENNH